MGYAEVAVNFPGSRSTFCYAIPSQLDIRVGQAVWVPFGTRIVQGVVVGLTGQSAVEVAKEISDLITDYPLLSPAQIGLAWWISQYYLCSLFDAIALMLPPAFERKFITSFRTVTPQESLPSLTLEQTRVLRLIEEKGKTSSRELEKKLGVRKADQITDQLLRYQLVVKSQELEKAKVKPKTVPYLKLIAGKGEIQSEITRLNKAKAYKQAAVLEFLSQQTQPITASELRKRLACSLASIRALESRRLLSIELINVRRDPLFQLKLKPTSPPPLTPSQQSVWKSIEDNWTRRDSSGLPPVFLLFGVTGSGKTEIYLRALDKIIAMGKRGICLVPEIALTPQTVERFASRFPGRVGILHSGLSLGEQFDEWQWIKEGKCDVVIGPRSALFAPQPALGLIILDEEHEWTYKQEDKSPRYHARDVAIKLAQLNDAVVILGSATPDIDSFHKTQLGEYHLLELKERITSHAPLQVKGGKEADYLPPLSYSPLPKVSIVDSREELKAGNTSLFSRLLLADMKEALTRGEQAILFLNRRGTATFIQCHDCGFVFRCPRCSVALTYHSVEKKLICHRCHYALPVPQACPQCFSQRLKFLGIGTQKVADEVKHFFPQARLLRWDRDVTTKRHAHERLLASFRDHKTDIVIGTQMIATGLDLPQVTLIGVISADTGLNFPDFRAGERTFQLLCQVAGRAGRGLKAGRVVFQTYSPGNYVIQAAASHDYVGFYKQEIEYRRLYNYPPFSHFIRLVYTHTNDELCRRGAERLSRIILAEKESKGIADFNLIGPVPAFASRVRGRYRWQLILRGRDPAQVLSQITLPSGWIVDVDPVGII
ncbi:MAG TPA: primosomal protein N' [Dehalococcoidia bacterium]|nr:primosomal protein N' [Dehalococcoidia bacterium]